MNDWTPRAYDPDFLTGHLPRVMDMLGEGFAVLDAHGVVQYINATAATLFNVEADAVLGWKLVEFPWEITDAAGAPIPKEDHPSLLTLADGTAVPPRVLGVTLPTRDGTLWLEVSTRPLRSPDGAAVEGSVSFFRDVGARVAAEADLRSSRLRFDALTALLPVGIFQADAQGRCLHVNEPWTRISGRSREEALGDGWMDAIHPDDREWVVEAAEAAVRAEGDFQAEHRYTRPDGEVRWVLCQARPFQAPGGEAMGSLGSVTDITEQKTAVAMKDQLIGLVSHELRAPLIAIGGALGHLSGQLEGLDETARRLLDMAVRNTELLQRLVGELLDIDRLTAGAAALSLDEISLRTVAQEATEVVEAVEAGAGVTVDLDAVDAALTVRADHDRILQVLTNLLSNAVKFSAGGATVWVEAHESPEEVVVSVRDTGPGIAPEDTEAIFERFVQAGPDDGRERRGAGLGLAIARAIVLRHGGRIWVESEPGEGSTFYFTVPGEPSPPGADPAPGG